jgi:hypothetical protein
MTDTCDGHPTRSASCDDGGAMVARGIARWLCLGATPAFAIMALMTSMLGGGPMDTLGSAGHGSRLTGMVPMYVLMSVIHSAPWLALISRRRNEADRIPQGHLPFPYSSWGYQSAPRPSGVVSNRVHSGSRSGAPRGSWPGSAISPPISPLQK